MQTRYFYNTQNQLTVLQKSVASHITLVMNFSYDALGRRCAKYATPYQNNQPLSQTRTDFLWDGDVLLAEQSVGEQIVSVPTTVTKKHGVEVGDIYGHKATTKKTVYDPKVWSNEAMLDMAQQAAVKDFNHKAAEYLIDPKKNSYPATVDGINFQIYLEKDANGNPYVSNVHPQE